MRRWGRWSKGDAVGAPPQEPVVCGRLRQSCCSRWRRGERAAAGSMPRRWLGDQRRRDSWHAPADAIRYAEPHSGAPTLRQRRDDDRHAPTGTAHPAASARHCGEQRRVLDGGRRGRRQRAAPAAAPSMKPMVVLVEKRTRHACGGISRASVSGSGSSANPLRLPRHRAVLRSLVKASVQPAAPAEASAVHLTIGNSTSARI